jgi:hypothetical protein
MRSATSGCPSAAVTALGHLGWRRTDERPLETYDLYHFERSPFHVLVNISDKPVKFDDRRRLSPVAIAFARAALRSPPRA